MTAHKIIIPADYLSWLEQRDNILSNAIQAQRHHVERAGALLSQCGLSPGG